LAAADPEIHSRPRGGLRGLRLAGGRASGAGGSRAAAPVRVPHAVHLFRGILLCDDRGSRPVAPGGARLVDDPGGEPAGGAGHARLPAPRAPRRLARVPLGVMIGESLSPTPRQRAEEILRRLAPVEREALLVKCWMSHDARWLMAAARECGMEVTSSPRWDADAFQVSRSRGESFRAGCGEAK